MHRTRLIMIFPCSFEDHAVTSALRRLYASDASNGGGGVFLGHFSREIPHEKIIVKSSSVCSNALVDNKAHSSTPLGTVCIQIKTYHE